MKNIFFLTVALTLFSTHQMKAMKAYSTDAGQPMPTDVAFDHRNHIASTEDHYYLFQMDAQDA